MSVSRDPMYTKWLRYLTSILTLEAGYAFTVQIKNACKFEVDLYDNVIVEKLSQSGVTERDFPSGTSGMLRMGTDPDATLAEFSNSADGSFSCYDISIIPTGKSGPGNCGSYSTCQETTGGNGFNVPMKIIPSKTDSDSCREVACLSASCSDAYLFPADNTKTRTCKNGVKYQVIFCPDSESKLIQDVIKPVLDVPVAANVDIVIANDVEASLAVLTPRPVLRDANQIPPKAKPLANTVLPPQTNPPPVVQTPTVLRSPPVVPIAPVVTPQDYEPLTMHQQQPQRTKAVAVELFQESESSQKVGIPPIPGNVQDISTRSAQKAGHLPTVFIAFGIAAGVACIAGAAIFYGRKKKLQLSQFYSKDESSARSRFSAEFSNAKTINQNSQVTEESF